MLVIKIVEVPFINHDEIKKVIVNELGEIYFNELIKLQCTDIILQFIQMVVINTEQPIVPIQISSDQFLVLINIFQVNNQPSYSAYYYCSIIYVLLTLGDLCKK